MQVGKLYRTIDRFVVSYPSYEEVVAYKNYMDTTYALKPIQELIWFCFQDFGSKLSYIEPLSYVSVIELQEIGIKILCSDGTIHWIRLSLWDNTLQNIG